MMHGHKTKVYASNFLFFSLVTHKKKKKIKFNGRFKESNKNIEERTRKPNKHTKAWNLFQPLGEKNSAQQFIWKQD